MNSHLTVGWETIKSFVAERGTSIQWVDLQDDGYHLVVIDGPFALDCRLPKDQATEFEASYKDAGNKTIKTRVTTDLEVDDKTLKTFCGFATTDANGVARVAVRIPAGGRFVAYGDAEFENREFGDRVSKIEITDKDRLIAMQVALALDPNATEPVSDETVAAMGEFPQYPVLGFYDERSIEPTAQTEGEIYGGMCMTFKYGQTEAQPVAGYAYVPEGMYFVIECRKATPVAGQRLQVSVDWASPTQGE